MINFKKDTDRKSEPVIEKKVVDQRITKTALKYDGDSTDGNN